MIDRTFNEHNENLAFEIQDLAAELKLSIAFLPLRLFWKCLADFF